MGSIEQHGYTARVELSGHAADVYLKRKDGAVVGEVNATLDEDTDVYVILMAILNDEVPKGKGIGSELYKKLADEIKRKTGKRLASEKKLQSQSAAKMWQRMVSQGDARGPVKMGARDYYVTEDELPGGLADRRKPSDFDPEQIKKGIEHELEHTDDPDLAREIAMDHLSEDPRYYDHLSEHISVRRLYNVVPS